MLMNNIQNRAPGQHEIGTLLSNTRIGCQFVTAFCTQIVNHAAHIRCRNFAPVNDITVIFGQTQLNCR